MALADGYRLILAYVNEKGVGFIPGEPIADDSLPEDLVHNCDLMGCNTLEHVVARIALPVGTKPIELDPEAHVAAQIKQLTEEADYNAQEVLKLKGKLDDARRHVCGGAEAEVKRRLTGKGLFVDSDLSEWRGICGHVWRKSQSDTCPLCALSQARGELERLRDVVCPADVESIDAVLASLDASAPKPDPTKADAPIPEPRRRQATGVEDGGFCTLQGPKT